MTHSLSHWDIHRKLLQFKQIHASFHRILNTIPLIIESNKTKWIRFSNRKCLLMEEMVLNVINSKKIMVFKVLSVTTLERCCFLYIKSWMSNMNIYDVLLMFSVQTSSWWLQILINQMAFFKILYSQLKKYIESPKNLIAHIFIRIDTVSISVSIRI